MYCLSHGRWVEGISRKKIVELREIGHEEPTTQEPQPQTAPQPQMEEPTPVQPQPGTSGRFPTDR